MLEVNGEFSGGRFIGAEAHSNLLINIATFNGKAMLSSLITCPVCSLTGKKQLVREVQHELVVRCGYQLIGNVPAQEFCQ